MVRSVLGFVGLVIVGFFVGVVSAASHRFHPYWGSALVILLVLAAATFSRSSRAWAGLLAFAGAWYVTVAALYIAHGPGDSVVILDDALGRTLFIGGAAAIVAVAFFPRRWMRDPEDLGNKESERPTV